MEHYKMRIINEKNQASLERIIDNLCNQLQKSPNDKFLQEQINEYKQSYIRQYGVNK